MVDSSASIVGFVAGTASGLTKCAVGHPWDTWKVRLQISAPGTYKGATDALMSIIRHEGPLALYKGVSLPAIAWSATDAVLLGSLHNYRLFFSKLTDTGGNTGRPLPTVYHFMAGMGAGWTNSFLTAPVEHVKTQLQQQSHRVGVRGASKGAQAVFTGPIDVIRQTIALNGVQGLYRALPGTLLFRTSFGPMFASYDVIHRQFAKLRGTRYEMSPGLSTFLAGGISSEIFWCVAFPADVVKNRMMADSLANPKLPTMRAAFMSVWNQAGPDASLFRRVRVFYTGFLPCILRAFPTNASALLAFETTMSLLGAQKTIQH